VRLESGDKHILDVDGNVVRTLSREKRYGKSDDDKVKLVLGCPRRAAVVRRIFRMYVDEGFGYKTIAEILNREGIPSPRNGTYARTARAGWSSRSWRIASTRAISFGTEEQVGNSTGYHRAKPSNGKVTLVGALSGMTRATLSPFATTIRRSSIDRRSREQRTSGTVDAGGVKARRTSQAEQSIRPTS
jgi:hypothetical protein